LHAGDLGHKLDDAALEAVGSVDILMIPSVDIHHRCSHRCASGETDRPIHRHPDALWSRSAKSKHLVIFSH
jgi:hypothetical protein